MLSGNKPEEEPTLLPRINTRGRPFPTLDEILRQVVLKRRLGGEPLAGGKVLLLRGRWGGGVVQSAKTVLDW